MLSEEVKFREFAFLSAWWNQSHTPLVASQVQQGECATELRQLPPSSWCDVLPLGA